ncbi:hypothetical protein ACSV5T_10310, partial [Veillonella sp. ZSJB6]
AISGALLATRFPFELNYVLSIVSLFIAAACSLGLVEPRRVVTEERMTWADIGAGFRFVWLDHQLLALSSVFIVTIGAFN